MKEMILTAVLTVISIAMVILVLAQQDRDAGFGTTQDTSTYWGKAKKHSTEGRILLLTRVLAAAYLFLAFALNYLV